MKGSLSIVGLGPGPSSQITQEVEFALMGATDIVGYGPYVARAATADAVLHASDNRVELERAHHAVFHHPARIVYRQRVGEYPAR